MHMRDTTTVKAFRVPAAEAKRLAALAPKFPLVRQSDLAREAFRRGLEALEREKLRDK